MALTRFSNEERKHLSQLHAAPPPPPKWFLTMPFFHQWEANSFLGMPAFLRALSRMIYCHRSQNQHRRSSEFQPSAVSIL